MSKEIIILSRDKAEELKAVKNTAIISFCDPITSRTPKGYRRMDYRGICENVFYVEIHDIDIEILSDYGLSFDTYFPEAHSLAKFIVKALNENQTIICQCEYGQSRSAACAAAIKEFYDGTGIKVFADYRYYPNHLIFNKLLDALTKMKSDLRKV